MAVVAFAKKMHVPWYKYAMSSELAMAWADNDPADEDVENVGTFTDAFGVEQTERMDPMPDPSMTARGPSGANISRLETMTGTAPRAPKSVESTPDEHDFEDESVRPDALIAPAMVGRLQRVVQRNRQMTQEAPSRDEGDSRVDLYNGFNPIRSSRKLVPTRRAYGEAMTVGTERVGESARAVPVDVTEPMRAGAHDAARSMHRQAASGSTPAAVGPRNNLVASRAAGSHARQGPFARQQTTTVPSIEPVPPPLKPETHRALASLGARRRANLESMTLPGGVDLSEHRNDMELEQIAMGELSGAAQTVPGRAVLGTQDAMRARNAAPKASLHDAAAAIAAVALGHRDGHAARDAPVVQTAWTAATVPAQGAPSTRRIGCVAPGAAPTQPLSVGLAAPPLSAGVARDARRDGHSIVERMNTALHSALAAVAPSVKANAGRAWRSEQATQAIPIANEPSSYQPMATPHALTSSTDAVAMHAYHDRATHRENAQVPAMPTHADRTWGTDPWRGPVPQGHTTETPEVRVAAMPAQRPTNEAGRRNAEPLAAGASVHAPRGEMHMRRSGRETPTLVGGAVMPTVSAVHGAIVHRGRRQS